MYTRVYLTTLIEGLLLKMSFNQVREMIGDEITESKINQLADQLLNQGIANTMLEAKEKAKNLLKTEKKIIKTHDQKREKLINYNDPRSKRKERPL